MMAALPQVDSAGIQARKLRGGRRFLKLEKFFVGVEPPYSLV